MEKAKELAQGQLVTPVVQIGEEVITGFDRNRLVAALQRLGLYHED